MIKKSYNTNLSKGTGLIQETLSILEFYKEGMDKSELIRYLLDNDVFGKATEKRVKDIVNYALYHRYMIHDYNVLKILGDLRKRFLSINEIKQLFLIYTARHQDILFDAIVQLYWVFSKRGEIKITKDDFKAFINEAIKDGRIHDPWASIMIIRVSAYLSSAMVDFELIDDKKNILQVSIFDSVGNYLAHELHFCGIPDQMIPENEDWKLFGLEKNEVIQILERISFKGHFIFQHSGEILKIAWQYKNMEELVDGLTR